MQIRTEFTATSSRNLARQLPAALLHPKHFDAWKIQPWTPVIVSYDGTQLSTWLVPAEPATIRLRSAPQRLSTVWLSRTLAEHFRMEFDVDYAVEISFDAVTAKVLPSLIDFNQQTHEISANAKVLAALGPKTKRVTLVSPNRVMVARVARTWKSRGAGEDEVRLNFGARTLLGIESAAQRSSTEIEVSVFRKTDRAYSRPEKATRAILWLLRSPLALIEIALRPLLRAPLVTLASIESSTIDDPHGVVRLATNTCELLGIESGDQVFLYWGTRRVRARACIETTWDEREAVLPKMVDWTPERRAGDVRSDSRITVPARLRAELGVPRNSIVSVRRSLVSRVRRRLIALTIPVVGIAVSVVALNVGLALAALLVLATLVLTLAGERVPGSSSRRWP